MKLSIEKVSEQYRRELHASDRTLGWFKPNLEEWYGKEFADQVLREARQEYERLIPQIPYAGGSMVHMTEDLMESARILAYLRVLKRHGKSLEECKTILHRSMHTQISKYPHLILKLGECRAFSKSFRRYLQRQAKNSQARKYPKRFMFNLNPGDRKEFDWRLDIFECGICKFYQEQNASEFKQIVRSIDNILCDKLSYGLYHTETLAEGAERCNPRLKGGRATQWR